MILIVGTATKEARMKSASRTCAVLLLALLPSILTSQDEFVTGTLLVKIAAEPGDPKFSEIQNRILQSLQTSRLDAHPISVHPIWKKEYSSALSRTLEKRALRIADELRMNPAQRETHIQDITRNVRRIVRINYSGSAYPPTVARYCMRIQGVEIAEPEPKAFLLNKPSVVSTPYYPNDPNYGANLTYHNFPDAWGVTKGDSNIVIAVMDQGINFTIPDLRNKAWYNSGETGNDGLGADKRTNGIDDDGNGYVDDWRGWDFEYNDNDPSPIGIPENHGIGVAGFAAAETDNGIGISGAGFLTKYMALKGISLYEGTLYAAVNGADFLNCSFGTAYSNIFQEVISFAADAGMLVIAAAGNSDNDEYFYPASYDDVVSAASVDYSGSGTPNIKSGFSSYGYKVDVMATGSNLMGISGDGNVYSGFTGTSFSSPIVCGLAALVKSVHPDWSPRRIAAHLRASAVPVGQFNSPLYANKLGRGRIDAYTAVTLTFPGIAIRGWEYVPSRSHLRAVLVNYGDSASSVQLSMTSLNENVMVIPASISIGAMPMGDSAVVELTVTPSPETNWQARPAVKLQWSDAAAGYNDFAVLELSAWENVNARLRNASNTTALSAPNRQTVWVGSDTIRRTTNGGATWLEVNPPIADGYADVISAIDADTAFVAGVTRGATPIVKTTDGGVTWSVVYTPPQAVEWTNLFFFDSQSGIAIGNPSTNAPFVIIRTEDGGATWHSTMNPPAIGDGGGAALNSIWFVDRLHGWFGSETGGFVFRTEDGGENWTREATNGTYIGAVRFISTARGIRVSESKDGLAISADGGITWNGIAMPTPPYVLYAATAITGTSQFWAAGYPAMVITSSNAGFTWKTERIPPSTFYLALASSADADSVTVWALSIEGDLYKRTAPKMNSVEFPRESVTHVAGYGSGVVTPIAVYPHLLTGDLYRITFDDTSSAEKMYSVYNLSKSMFALQDAPASPGEGPLFDGLRIFLSDYPAPRVDEKNTRWTVGASTLTGDVFNPVIVIGTDTLVGKEEPFDFDLMVSSVIVDTSTPFLGVDAIPVKFTVNNLTTGKQAEFLFNDTDMDGAISPLDEVFILGRDEKEDLYLSWEVMFLPPVSGLTLPQPGDVFAIRTLKPFTHRDVFEFRAVLSGLEPISPAVPVSARLEQNYPNPFNPVTTIRFELPARSHVTLKVYDLLGREIETLLKGVADGGAHTIEWNTAGRASGVYFYRLETERVTITKKMLLIR